MPDSAIALRYAEDEGNTPYRGSDEEEFSDEEEDLDDEELDDEDFDDDESDPTWNVEQATPFANRYCVMVDWPLARLSASLLVRPG